MLNNELLREALNRRPAGTVVLDSAEAAARRECAILDSMAEYLDKSASLDAAGIVNSWVDSVDDDDDEEVALDDLIASCVSGDSDDEPSEEEIESYNNLRGKVFDYLLDCGVSEDDAVATLNDDASASERVRDYLMEQLPDGEEETLDSIYAFAFDDVELDGIKVQVRNGKKVIRKTNMPGHNRRSLLARKRFAKFRSKLVMKMHNSMANRKRARSMARRKAMGLNKR